MNRLTLVFIIGFLVWCVVGAIFRLFVMTTLNQPYDAVPIITIALAVTGMFIISIDKKAPHE